MSGQQNDRRERYTQAQKAFDSLGLEEKGIFIVEAAVSTVARGLEDAGHALAHILEGLFPLYEASDPESTAPAEAQKTARKSPPRKKTTRRVTKKKE